MKRVFFTLVIVLCTWYAESVLAEGYSCHGRLPNPITDVCWQCVFPIKIGSVPVATYGQIDSGGDPPLICTCPAPPPIFIRIGIGVVFWEAARVAEAVTTPFCSPLLNGATLADTGGQVKRGSARHTAGNQSNGFFHVHWFNFPLYNWMSFMTDTVCVQSESFDVVMLSEFEPTWQDDELATLLSPEAMLFANPLSQTACAADCVAASAGFPLNELFWCLGCQGSLYPMTGNVINQESGLQGGLLAIQRMHAKLHRTGVALDRGSPSAMCVANVQPILPKRGYKTQMLYPRPMTSTAQPYGRSTTLWGMSREYPVQGEDFAHLIWRRRVCCAY
jgi:conjugal transfer pilus assembly protein TraU